MHTNDTIKKYLPGLDADVTTWTKASATTKTNKKYNNTSLILIRPRHREREKKGSYNKRIDALWGKTFKMV